MPTLAQRMLDELDRTRRPFWENKGAEKGKLEGIIEGRQEGRQEGKQEGKQEEKELIARGMLALKCSISLISQVTGLTPEELNRLK